MNTTHCQRCRHNLPAESYDQDNRGGLRRRCRACLVCFLPILYIQSIITIVQVQERQRRQNQRQSRVQQQVPPA